MNEINIMDCTLRDGGWVNGFDFGRETMRDILVSDQLSGAEFIELGYLDQKKGSFQDKSMYAEFNVLEKIFENVNKTKNTTRMVMIDYGKFDAQRLPQVKDISTSVIDGIRMCFHKRNLAGAIEYGKQILDRGYKLFIQPMVISRYSDDEIKSMIEDIQKELQGFEAFYIVDSFGTMKEKAVCDRILLADRCLDSDIMLGLHTHDNMNLCYENAVAVCDLNLNRDLIIDCTLEGIGKGPGNLSLEKITRYLNEKLGKDYDLDMFSKVSERCIKPLRDHYEWGYAPEYELCSKYAVTSTYARIFCREYKHSLQELEIFLKNMSDSKKDSFDRKYLDEYIKNEL